VKCPNFDDGNRNFKYRNAVDVLTVLGCAEDWSDEACPTLTPNGQEQAKL